MILHLPKLMLHDLVRAPIGAFICANLRKHLAAQMILRRHIYIQIMKKGSLSQIYELSEGIGSEGAGLSVTLVRVVTQAVNGQHQIENSLGKVVHFWNPKLGLHLGGLERRIL